MEPRLETIDITLLRPHEKNSYYFDDMVGGKWQDFLESVRTSGIINPLVITQNNIVVSGCQRLRACKELGITKIPCIRKFYHTEWAELKDLIETNVRQRGAIDCSAIKLGRIISKLEEIYDGGKSLPEDSESIKGMLGMNRESYRLAKRLMTLIPELQDLVEEGNITQSVASRIIARLSKKEQRELYEQIPHDVKLTCADIQAAQEALKAKDRELELANKEVDAVRKKLEERDIEVAGQYIAERDKAVDNARRAHERYVEANEEVRRVQSQLRSLEKQTFNDAEEPDHEEITALKERVTELRDGASNVSSASNVSNAVIVSEPAGNLVAFLSNACDSLRTLVSNVGSTSDEEYREIESKTLALITQAGLALATIRPAV